MKEAWKEIGYAVILGMVVPGLLLHWSVRINSGEYADFTPVETVFSTVSEETGEMIQILDGDTVIQMDLEDYVSGVVLAEMPANFEIEALKAQAIVARTYAFRASNGKSKHDHADVCTVSSCCQAYQTPADYLGQGGNKENLDKVRSAAMETGGMVLTYEGELIEATYFSCSGGITEDAVAVWGADVPYLVSTESPGEEKAAHYLDTVTMNADDFLSALSLSGSSSPDSWFGQATYTAGGGVDQMEICGAIFSGTELRKLLNLKSTAMEIDMVGDTIRIRTRGYGHRVGMSQYGADAMAAQGSTYDQILAHYYRGTQLEKLTD